MILPRLFLTLLVLCLIPACLDNTQSEYILITGGTLINTSENGSNSDDLQNSYILIKDSLILDCGSLDDIPDIPDACRIINAQGKYIIPGLIDGFGTINNQAYADAYLSCGVTTVVGVESLRRGELFLDGNPSPNILLMDEVGDIPQTDEEIKQNFLEASLGGIKLMLLMYKLSAEQVKLSLELAEQYNIATIGELGYTSYKEAAELGVESFVHVTRYSLDTAPADLREAVAEEPFSDDMDSPKWQYYRYLSLLDIDGDNFLEHARTLGDYKGFLIPTLSLLYLDLPGHTNPWEDPLADLIDPADVNNPADRQTGNHDYDSIYQEAYTRMAVKQMDLTEAYYRNGAKFITGSAADVWGTMPGLSLHTELELLKRSGLSNREVIAAATSNFSEAYNWKIGRIEKDYFADILILDKNPLDSLSHLRKIDHIVLNGRILGEELRAKS